MTVRAAIYIRTSPDCIHSADEQTERLMRMGAERGWRVADVFRDHPTSTKAVSDRRTGEAAMIDAIRSGKIDRVLIWSIDRIGKSLIELVNFLEICRRASASIWVDDLKLDTDTSNGMSLFDLSTMMASHLRQSRSDRILRGQAAARAMAIRLGRPPIGKAKVEKAKRELAAGKGVRQVARIAGISAASVSRLKNSMLLATAT